MASPFRAQEAPLTPLNPDSPLRQRIFATLSGCDLFRALDAQLVSQLQDRVTALALDDGEALVTEGSPSDSFFLVLLSLIHI